MKNFSDRGTRLDPLNMLNRSAAVVLLTCTKVDCKHAVMGQLPGRYCTDAASIGPVLARCWHITACLQGSPCIRTRTHPLSVSYIKFIFQTHQSAIQLALDLFFSRCLFRPVNMPVWPSTGPFLVRCWQHRPSTGPVLAHYGMCMGQLKILTCFLRYPENPGI